MRNEDKHMASLCLSDLVVLYKYLLSEQDC